MPAKSLRLRHLPVAAGKQQDSIMFEVVECILHFESVPLPLCEIAFFPPYG